MNTNRKYKEKDSIHGKSVTHLLNNSLSHIKQMSQYNFASKEEIAYPCISSKNVYDLLAKIPPGKVSTYGDIAKTLGHPGASRAIGRIIANNPNPIVVPCHRVVKSNGEIGGFMYGEDKKKELLEKEGIKIENRAVKNFKEFRFVFD